MLANVAVVTPAPFVGVPGCTRVFPEPLAAMVTPLPMRGGADLIERLERHGVRRTQECLGLVLRDLDTPIPFPREVEVREVDVGDRAAFDAELAERLRPLTTDGGIEDTWRVNFFVARPE